LPIFVITLACNSNGNQVLVESKPQEERKILESTLRPIGGDTLKPRSRIVMDPARQVTDIDTEFPFDIELESADRSVKLSNEVISKGERPTVILFWLTTCYPCRLEMQAIKKQYETWKSETDFDLIAVSTDFEQNFDNFAKRIVEDEMPWPVYRDKRREFRKVLPGQLNGLPQTFVFDKSGKIAYHSRKYRSGDEHKLYEQIKKASK